MSKVYKFSDFILDGKSVSFYHQNNYISLSSRAFDILLYLIERRGEIVGKDEILDKVWNDSFVEEANLPVHISALRRILQEKKGESRFIRTISGRGYSFIAEVEEVENGQALNKSENGKKIEIKENISIAVLPFTFQNSSEDNEYLANGVTQSLIGDLSKIQDLRVLAYSAVSSYKNSRLELQEIGFLLDADKILTGSISEFKGKWEISAELINAQDKRCLWVMSQVFETENIFEIKKEISSVIVEKLKLKLTKTNSQKEIDSEAQKLYYRGKSVLESRAGKDDIKGTLYQALKFFNEAVRREPNYALAYTGIGSVYVSLHNHNLMERETANAEAKKALKMALSADNTLSEAHVLKGSLKVMFDFNFEEANHSFDTAIDLSPNNPNAYHWKSLSLLYLGNFDEAFSLEKKAVELDPILSRFSESLSRIFYYAGKYNEAIVHSDELLEFNETTVAPNLFLALSYAQLGFFELASEAIEKTIKLRNRPDIILPKACILGLFGRKDESLKTLEEVLSSFPAAAIDETDIAAVYSVLNDSDTAFKYLDQALESKKIALISLKINPQFKNLRNDKRFDELLVKINLK